MQECEQERVVSAAVQLLCAFCFPEGEESWSTSHARGLSLDLPMDTIPQWRHPRNRFSDSSKRGPDLLSHGGMCRPLSIASLLSLTCPHQCCKWTTWPFKTVLSVKLTITFYEGVCPGFNGLAPTFPAQLMW